MYARDLLVCSKADCPCRHIRTCMDNSDNRNQRLKEFVVARYLNFLDEQRVIIIYLAPFCNHLGPIARLQALEEKNRYFEMLPMLFIIIIIIVIGKRSSHSCKQSPLAKSKCREWLSMKKKKKKNQRMNAL